MKQVVCCNAGDATYQSIFAEPYEEEQVSEWIVSCEERAFPDVTRTMASDESVDNGRLESEAEVEVEVEQK